jgi:hypothetical protein
MPSQEASERIVKFLHRYSQLLGEKFLEFVKNVPSLIKEFKGVISIVIAWLVVSELVGFPVLRIVQSIWRIILYPLNWVLFKTSFEITGIPEVFLLLMPLVILIIVSFMVIISTED